MSKVLFRLAFGVLLTTSQAAWAAPLLDFGVITPNPPSASISYAGGAAPLIGANIEVDEVVGLGTPLNNNVVTDITSGVLSFTTGNFTSSTPTTWNFGSGGSITIMGDDGLGAPGVTALLSGSFLSAVVTNIGGAFKIAGSAFLSIVDPDLAAFYGLTGGATNQFGGSFNLMFVAAGTPPGGFASSQVLSGDIVVSPAPEPGTLAMAGLAAVGGILWSRRRGRGVMAV